MTDSEKVRKAILRTSRRKIRPRARIAPVCRSALKDRSFPISFFIRNILALQKEAAWLQGSPRVRKNDLLRLFEERARIFLEVKRWLGKRRGGDAWARQICSLYRKPFLPSGYCSHCGGCCEIASGFPDFPSGAILPLRWQRLFGDGLGKGHRFCAFLWELDASGLSLCAVHPWRSRTCRVFEEEECDYFMKDLEKTPLFDPQAFSVACGRLSHLINRG